MKTINKWWKLLENSENDKQMMTATEIMKNNENDKK